MDPGKSSGILLQSSCLCFLSKFLSIFSPSKVTLPSVGSYKDGSQFFQMWIYRIRTLQPDQESRPCKSEGKRHPLLSGILLVSNIKIFLQVLYVKKYLLVIIFHQLLPPVPSHPASSMLTCDSCRIRSRTGSKSSGKRSSSPDILQQKDIPPADPSDLEG